MGDNFKIMLEAMIDQSSLTNAQKQVAKERLKIGADISVEDFAKSKQAIEKQIVDLAKGIKTILGDAISDKQSTQWANQYYKQMIDGAKQAEKQLAREAAQRQKNLELAQKQAAANRKAALDYTRNANRKLSDAVSKYSYGDSKEADKMIKQMNRGVSNFGNLSDIEGSAKRFDAIIDGIIANLKKSHAETLKSINAEIKAEQEKAKIISDFNKQQDKAIPNGIDASIEKRRQESKQFALELEKSMNIRQSVSNGNYDAELKSVEAAFRNLGLESEEVESKVKDLKTALNNLKSPSEGQSLIDLDANFNNELERAKNNVKILKTDMDSIYNPKRQASLKNDILNWLSKNTAASAEARQKLQQYYDLLSKGKVNLSTLENIQKELKEIDALERKNGNLGKSFLGSIGDEMKSFARWTLSSALIMKPIQSLRESISIMKEVDSELVNIQKVTNATAEEMKKLTKEAYAMATAYGRTPTEFLKSVTAFSRAGYGEAASQLGELSMLAQNVGDINEEIADGFLLSADAAWKYGGNVEDLRRILDGFNELSNRTATDVEKLAEGIQVSGSIFAQAGLSAQDYAGIIGTATAKTQLSGNEMSRAWRTILMNIRQIKGGSRPYVQKCA